MAYDTEVINQIIKLDKKYDNGWSINMDSHGIEKYKRNYYGYGRNERTKTNL
jgi:LPS sulfotransferase NodH